MKKHSMALSAGDLLGVRAWRPPSWLRLTPTGMVGTITRPTRNARQPDEPHAVLYRELMRRLQERHRTREVIRAITHATNGRAYVVGGTHRRALFQLGDSGDIDVMVPNGDVRAFKALDALGLPFELNRHQQRCYHYEDGYIDISEPSTFHKGFRSVSGALRYFDLRINALAVHLGTGCVLDPFGVLQRREQRDPGINWPRWNEMPPVELAVLAVRLVRILEDTPQLVVPDADCCRLRENVVPGLLQVEWDFLHARFPQGREELLNRLDLLLDSRRESRVRTIPSRDDRNVA